MGSYYFAGKSIVNGIKMGMLTISFGSIFATPISSFLFISAFPIPPNDALKVAITMFMCTHGVFFNIIPYTLAGVVSHFLKLGKKSVAWVGIIAMGIATAIGIHNLIDISEISDIKIFPDILFALAFLIALFCPYFLVFILINFFRKNINT